MNGSGPFRFVRVEDPGDPKIAAFRDIRERDLTGRDGRFVAEGTVVVSVLARVHALPGKARAEAILVLENRLEGIAELLARFPDDVPVFVASRSVMDAVTGFPIHRGVLAIGVKPPEFDLSDLLNTLPENPLVVVASAVSNHDNAGGLFRNAAVLGADAVIFDSACCDPWYRKSMRVSVGAVMAVPSFRDGEIGSILDQLLARGITPIALSPKGAIEVDAVEPERGVALVLGTEGEGLPASVLQRVETVRIAQAPGMDSLNLATASGIALHAIARRMGRI